MTQYSKQVKSTSIALLIFSLLTISIDAILLSTQIINELLPTFGIGIFLGLFGILAGSYGICAAKATKAEHFFGKYTTSGCWSVFGGIFAFFGLAWLSFAFSCHAVCIGGYQSDDPSGFYMILTGHSRKEGTEEWIPIAPVNNTWLVNGTCINFQKDWTAIETTTVEPEDNNGTSLDTTASIDTLSTEAETSTSSDGSQRNGWSDAGITINNIVVSGETTEETTTVTFDGTTSTTSENNEDPVDGHFENKSIVVAYMSLYLTELILVFILFIIFIVLSNATGCCYCETNTVDIEADEEEPYKTESSSDEDSSDSSSDDSSDEE